MDEEKLKKIIEVENSTFRYNDNSSNNNNYINDTIKTTICLNTIENLKFKYIVSIRSIVKEVEDIKKQFKIENDDVIDTIYLKRYSKKEFLSNVLDAIMDDDLNSSTSYGFLLFIMIEMNILEDYTLFDIFNTKVLQISNTMEEDKYVSYGKSLLILLNTTMHYIGICQDKCDDEKIRDSFDLMFMSQPFHYHLERQPFNKEILKGIETLHMTKFYSPEEFREVQTPLKMLDLIHQTFSIYVNIPVDDDNTYAEHFEGFLGHFTNLMENTSAFDDASPYLLNFTKYLFNYLSNKF